MATFLPSDKWTIYIHSVCEARQRIVFMPPTMTIAEVRQRWLTLTSFTGFTDFRSEVGDVLPEDRTLGEVGETVPNSKKVNLFVDEAYSIGLRLFNTEKTAEVILRLTETPAEVFPLVRAALPILEDREIRLQTKWGPLEDTRSLMDQDVDPQTSLLVDPRIEVVLTDVWEGERRTLSVFSSDLVAVLAGDDFLNRHRFLLDDDPLLEQPQLILTEEEEEVRPQENDGILVDEDDDDLLEHILAEEEDEEGILAADKERRSRFLTKNYRSLDVLSRFAALMGVDSKSLRVWDVSSRVLTLCVDGRILQRVVWPDTTLARAFPGRLSITWPLMLDGQWVFPSDAILSVGAAQRSVVSEVEAVHVQLSDGSVALVRVPKRGCVADVAAVVEGKERRGRWRLKCGGRILGKDELLPAGSALSVWRDAWTFTVELRDRSARWTSDRHEADFMEFVMALSGCSGVEMVKLVEKVFRCRGCGRRVRQGQQQRLPANCCRERSLWMIEEATKAEIGSQAETWLRAALDDNQSTAGQDIEEAESKKHSPSVSDAEAQTEPAQCPSSIPDSSCQTSLEWTEKAMSAEITRDAVSTQHPLQKRSFYLYNGTDTGSFRGGREIPLLLSPNPTVGEVRMAVARLLERPAQSTRLGRRVAAYHGLRVLLAWHRHFVYITEDGSRSASMEKVERVKEEDLFDDTVEFEGPADQCLALEAYNNP